MSGAPLKLNNTPPKPKNMSKLTHRESLKRSLVGVGGLEVRGRQRLALTSVCYLMIAHLPKRANSYGRINHRHDDIKWSLSVDPLEKDGSYT